MSSLTHTTVSPRATMVSAGTNAKLAMCTTTTWGARGAGGRGGGCGDASAATDTVEITATVASARRACTLPLGHNVRAHLLRVREMRRDGRSHLREEGPQIRVVRLGDQYAVDRG